jgi:hypothetical protein
LTGGNPITFVPNTIPYVAGVVNTPPPLQLFSTTENGETFGFTVTSFIPILNGTALSITDGSGIFTGTGVVNYTPTPATFQFTTQYSGTQPVGSLTSFSASASATPPAVPEPATLALFGSGLVGIVGIARRRFRAS